MDRISLGEGKIFDFKLKSILFIAQNSKFPVIGFGASEGEIKYITRIKKNIGFILPGMASDTKKYNFVIIQEPTLAKFNSVVHNTIKAVITCIAYLLKNHITHKFLYSNILLSSVTLLTYLVTVKETVLKSYYFLLNLKVIEKTDAKQRIKKPINLSFSLT